MFSSVGFTVESLSARLVPDKLARAGIPVLSAKSLGKTAVRITIAGKDRKKAFAILRDACYNIKDVRLRGGGRIAEAARRYAALALGAAVFSGCILFLQTRILKVEFSGSGAYYAREILAIFREEGIGTLSSLPADRGPLTAKILALPRVEFCSFDFKGGILTVDVETGEETQRPKSLPLLAPASGILEQLTLVRGTALFSEGDEVRIGEPVVENYSLFGEERREVTVIARITVRYEAEREYAATEEEALAQAYLDFGELQNITVRRTEKGYRIGGTARSTAASGLT